MNSLDDHAHARIALFLYDRYWTRDVNNVSVTARFLLQMRKPGFIEKNRRVVYSMVMLAHRYLYSIPGSGVHLTSADVRDNVVVIHTLRKVCPLWRVNMTP